MVSFRARAHQERTASIGCSNAVEPWEGMGLYSTLLLTSEWQNFEEIFEATADNDNAGIQFDLGGSDVDVEISGITIRGL